MKIANWTWSNSCILMLYRPIRVFWNRIKHSHLFSISWGDMMRVLFWYTCALIPNRQNTKTFSEKGECPSPQCMQCTLSWLFTQSNHSKKTWHYFLIVLGNILNVTIFLFYLVCRRGLGFAKPTTPICLYLFE